MKGMRRESVVFLVAIIALALIPRMVSGTYFIHLLIICGIHIILTLGLDIPVGYTNQVSLAHGAMFGVGAYAAALLMLRLGMSFWLAFPLASVFTALLGFLLGIPGLRVRGHYFAILTLGMQMVLYLIMNQWYGLTQGSFGLANIPGPPPIAGWRFDTTSAMYYLVAAIVLLLTAASYRLSRSSIGLEMRAVREDELAASCMGIHVNKTRLIAFALSAFCAGVAGSLHAAYMGSIHPEEFNILTSVSLLTMVLLGGRGTLAGPILGAIALTLMPEYLRAFAEYRMPVYGLLIILIVIFQPNGLAGLLKNAPWPRRAPDAQTEAAL